MTARQVFVRTAFSALVFMTAAGTATIAGSPVAPGQDSAKPTPLATIPVRVEVTMSRFQGEKKVSSLPYTLLASAVDGRPGIGNGGQNVSMRMGIDVPIGSTTSTTATKVEYRSVGTNIDCRVGRLDDTHFTVYVNVSDSSIYSPDGDVKSLKNLDPAAFRTFSTSNTVVLREGQTVLFGTGTDKISGETLKIEVTMTVVK
jgi:hypothetical protein